MLNAEIVKTQSRMLTRISSNSRFKIRLKDIQETIKCSKFLLNSKTNLLSPLPSTETYSMKWLRTTK